MKQLLIVITILVLTSCEQHDKIIVQDISIEDIDSSDRHLLPPPPPVNPALLKGSWTDGSTDNETLSFNKNHVYYVAQLQSYPYKLKSDSITINYKDHTYKAQIWLLNDTLTMRDEDGERKFWRFRN